MAAALATARNGCVWFGGGSDSGRNNDGSGQRTTTAQHTCCKVLVLSRFPLISDRTKCTQRCPRCVEQIYQAGTRVGGAKATLTATASNAHVFVLCSLSLSSLIYFGRDHELSGDMFFPQSCSSRDSYKRSLKNLDFCRVHVESMDCLRYDKSCTPPQKVRKGEQSKHNTDIPQHHRAPLCPSTR